MSGLYIYDEESEDLFFLKDETKESFLSKIKKDYVHTYGDGEEIDMDQWAEENRMQFIEFDKVIPADYAEFTQW